MGKADKCTVGTHALRCCGSPAPLQPASGSASCGKTPRLRSGPSPALLNFLSSFFSLFNSKTLSKRQPAPKRAHPAAERPTFRSKTRIVLVLQHLRIHIGGRTKRSPVARKNSRLGGKKAPEPLKQEIEVRRDDGESFH